MDIYDSRSDQKLFTVSKDRVSDRTDMYPAATMETATATTEETYCGNLPATRVTVPSGYPANIPAGNARVDKVGAVVCKRSALPSSSK